jgi:hypothetical protein
LIVISDFYWDKLRIYLICIIVKDLLEYYIVDELILPHTHLKLRSDGIVMINYPDNFSFTRKDSIESVNAIGEITKGIPHPLLKIPGKYTTVDKETREHVAKGDGARFSVAEAFIIKSIAHKLIANFYIKVEKPQKPTHFFSEIPDAEKWLRTFII